MIDTKELLGENARLRTEVNRLRAALAEIGLIVQRALPPLVSKPPSIGSIMDINSDVAD